MRILIVGVGYVGLVSGACFAEMGHTVTCLDIDEQKINRLRAGIIPIYEPGLEEIIKRNASAGRLLFSSDYSSAVPHQEVCFIAVNTPSLPSGRADTAQVEACAKMIGAHLSNYAVVATKSTVPVGTTHLVGRLIAAELAKRDVNFSFDVVSNPEFLKEGNAVQDFMKPDRVVVGADKEIAAAIMRKIYSPFMLSYERLLLMDVVSAELSKYACNAMLATRISFMNQMAAFCERVGADVGAVRKAIGFDERIGNKFLYPGVGYGGSCLPKDVKALISQGEEAGADFSIIKSVEAANQAQKKVMGFKLRAYFEKKGGLAGKTIGILGLAFKPDTDDLREAPALCLIEELLQVGAHLRLYDPIALSKAQKIIPSNPSITWCTSELEAAEGADALVLMTEWKQFRLLDFSLFLAKMKGRAFFDGRNQYSREEMRQKGFDYLSIGRSPVYNKPSAA